MPNEQDYYRHRKSALEQVKNEKWVPGLQAAMFEGTWGTEHDSAYTFRDFLTLSVGDARFQRRLEAW